jgi:hypothetical protein
MKLTPALIVVSLIRRMTSSEEVRQALEALEKLG